MSIVPRSASYSSPPPSLYRWKFFSYVSRDCESLLQRLRDVNGVVVGFVHKNQLYPVRIESPTMTGNWAATVNVFVRNRLNVVLRNDPIPSNARNVYFVKPDLKNIYRLDKSTMAVMSSSVPARSACKALV